MAFDPEAAAPVLAQASGTYGERPPTPALRAHFSRVWFHRVARDAAPTAVVPDGNIDLQWIDGVLRIAGPDRQVNVEHLQPGATVIGLRFRVGAARNWLRVDASEIADTRLPLGDFWGSAADRLGDFVGDAATMKEAAERIETALAARMPVAAPPDKASRAIFSLLRRHRLSENRNISWLGEAVGMSERTLRRRCHHVFGYGPKRLGRVFRFQRFLGLARGGPATLADLAAEAGYADQAHLTRDAQRMAALTPLSILRQLRG